MQLQHEPQLARCLQKPVCLEASRHIVSPRRMQVGRRQHAACCRFVAMAAAPQLRTAPRQQQITFVDNLRRASGYIQGHQHTVWVVVLPYEVACGPCCCMWLALCGRKARVERTSFAILKAECNSAKTVLKFMHLCRFCKAAACLPRSQETSASCKVGVKGLHGHHPLRFSNTPVSAGLLSNMLDCNGEVLQLHFTGMRRPGSSTSACGRDSCPNGTSSTAQVTELVWG